MGQTPTTKLTNIFNSWTITLLFLILSTSYNNSVLLLTNDILINHYPYELKGKECFEYRPYTLEEHILPVEAYVKDHPSDRAHEHLVLLQPPQRPVLLAVSLFHLLDVIKVIIIFPGIGRRVAIFGYKGGNRVDSTAALLLLGLGFGHLILGGDSQMTSSY